MISIYRLDAHDLKKRKCACDKAIKKMLAFEYEFSFSLALLHNRQIQTCLMETILIKIQIFQHRYIIINHEVVILSRHLDLTNRVVTSQNLVPAKFDKNFNQNAESVAIVAFYSCSEEQKGQYGILVPVSKSLKFF